VPAEISSSWAPEALKSQTVAVRSYARATRGGDLLDFYADPRDQAYGGASSETTATNKAVANTAGVVAVYDGKPIRASYHSSDGGYTEDSSYVFGRPVAYLKAVRDVDPQGRPFERLVNSPWTQWSGTLNPDGSAQLNIGSITGVRVLERSTSGRATKVKVRGTAGKKTISGEYNIGNALKTNGLKLADGSRYPAGTLPSARVSFGSGCG
jgi:stage II sporulation protein D